MATRVRLTLEEKKAARTSYQKEYYRKNRDKLRAQIRKRSDSIEGRKKTRFHRVKAKYKLTKQEYLKLEQKQNYRCAICRNLPKDNRPLYVDHNHDTGYVRGLLCPSCNTGLGGFKDNILILDEAKKYILKEVEETGLFFYKKD